MDNYTPPGEEEIRTEPPKPGKALGLISMILGIAGIATLNGGLSVAAVVTGVADRYARGSFSRTSKTGFILGIVAESILVLCGAALIIALFCVPEMSEGIKSFFGFWAEAMEKFE